jgi:manganese/zinc/iron transport system permease protein
MVGSFTLLRKRALMADALSHATAPGIGLAFIVATTMGLDGKSLPVLLFGATVSGLVGVGVILVLRNTTRLKEDTVLGAVLSVFFGAGVALLSLSQQMERGHAAGLESFIYGKTASMGIQDTMLIGVAALICIAACFLFFKELKLLCFDSGFAASSGFPVVRLDLLLMAMVVTVTIVGLQAVGLILMIALFVIPAAAARFWTEKMWTMFLISGVLGALGGMLGAGASALFSKLPSGAMIVLVCTGFFLISLVFGTARGVLIRWLRRSRLNRSVDYQHLLRAAYEYLEGYGRLAPGHEIPMDALLDARSWSVSRLRRVVRRAESSGLLRRDISRIRLTEKGFREAARITRQHRLWELYLITYADIAPGRVDRDADAIEHVLEPEIVAELEATLEESGSDVPSSPHGLSDPAIAGVASQGR